MGRKKGSCCCALCRQRASACWPGSGGGDGGALTITGSEQVPFNLLEQNCFFLHDRQMKSHTFARQSRRFFKIVATSKACTTPHTVPGWRSYIKERMNDSDWQKLYFGLEKESANGRCNVAEKDENRLLNRWSNVLPFDDHRVLLECPEGDYINASMVEESTSGHRYIATQGPLAETTGDFWAMVWQQRVPAIVMLCKTRENDVEKCHQYWPQAEKEERSDQGLTFSQKHLKVVCEKEEDFGDYKKRHIRIISTSTTSSPSPREDNKNEEDESISVCQFHFLAWPDFGVPRSPRSILSFLSDVRATRGEEASTPIVVHCSAGIGRTGTFCLIDAFRTVIERTRKAPSLAEVCSMLLGMRRFRRGLVQTPQQLWFSYLAIREVARQVLQVEGGGENGVVGEKRRANDAGSAQESPHKAEERKRRPVDDSDEENGLEEKKQRRESKEPDS